MSQEIIEMLGKESFLMKIKERVCDGPKAIKYVKMFETALGKSPSLLKCSTSSIRMAFYTLAELDLSPIAAHGQAYLIPYGNQCQLQISYRGLMTIAKRDGGVKSISAHIVYKDDDFNFKLGTSPGLNHVVNIDGVREDQEIRAVYAVAVLADGSSLFEVMSKSDVDKIRVTAKSGDTWKKHYGEMARKTVVKRLCKYLPVSSETLDAIEVDDSLYSEIPEAKKASSVTELIKAEVVPSVIAPAGADDFFEGEELEPVLCEQDISIDEFEEVPDVKTADDVKQYREKEPKIFFDINQVNKNFARCKNHKELQESFVNQRSALKKAESFTADNEKTFGELYRSRGLEIDAEKAKAGEVKND